MKPHLFLCGPPFCPFAVPQMPIPGTWATYHHRSCDTSHPASACHVDCDPSGVTSPLAPWPISSPSSARPLSAFFLPNWSVSSFSLESQCMLHMTLKYWRFCLCVSVSPGGSSGSVSAASCPSPPQPPITWAWSGMSCSTLTCPQVRHWPRLSLRVHFIVLMTMN